MWEFDKNWLVYKLNFDDFGLAVTEKTSPDDTHSLLVTSRDLKKTYFEHDFTDLEVAKERALVLYSKVSGRAMNSIQKELFERQVA